MIDIRIDPPKLNTAGMTLEEQVTDLRTYLHATVDTLNAVLDGINNDSSFSVSMSGTPAQLSKGTGERKATASALIDMGGKKITGLGMPSDASDAASMEYVLTVFEQKGAV